MGIKSQLKGGFVTVMKGPYLITPVIVCFQF